MEPRTGVMRSFLALATAAAVGSFASTGARASSPQTRDGMDSRIPAPIPAKYKDIRDAKHWLNPIVTIRAEGIEMVSQHLPNGRKTVPVAALRDLVIGLPVAAWPYGRVVLASEIGIRRGDGNDDQAIKQNHDAADRILKALDITVDWWPSADPEDGYASERVGLPRVTEPEDSSDRRS